MSNLEADVEIADCRSGPHPLEPTVEVLTPRPVLLGPRQEVRRVLPNRERRMIGAWCFVDHYGPQDIAGQRGMWVPPHPHTGLQTVSWLLAGEVRHRDSLGSNVVVLPGQLNLMTAGAGIAHSEESPADHSRWLHGLQLWVALPDPARQEAQRSFGQYVDLPHLEQPGLRATVVMGEFAGVASPASTYSEIVGVELEVAGQQQIELRPELEYGVLAVDGPLDVAGQMIAQSEICYLGGGRSSVELRAEPEGRAFLLGGEPFEEELVMWWNFIGRSHEEIVESREAWNAGGGDQFGVVRGFDGDRLPAPPMPTVRLRSRGRTR